MKLILVTLLVLAAYAQARHFIEQTSLDDFVHQSIEFAEKRRQFEESLTADQRVIGGQSAALGQVPWQAALQVLYPGLGTGACGGSVISANRVITAAHCWFSGSAQASQVTVRVGTVLFFGNDGITVVSNQVTMHPSWFPALVRNDIAVIRLPNSISFNNNVSPISLPTGSETTETFAGSTVQLSGYGLTSNGGSVSQTLNRLNLNVITNAQCASSFFPTLVQPTNICTSGAGNIGACQGDSGGPIAVIRGGRNILAGVVSFGAGAALGGCQGGHPTVYARVTSFLSWIHNEL